MNFIKQYSWKNDILYYLLLPKFLALAVFGILCGWHELDDFTAREYLGIHFGLCDAAAGRYYTIEWEDEK